MSRQTWVARKSHDPCFGMRVIRKGDTLTVIPEPGKAEGWNTSSLCDYRILKCTNGETYQGAGMGISTYELNSFAVRVS